MKPLKYSSKAKSFLWVLIYFIFMFSGISNLYAEVSRPQITYSKDGTAVSYEIYGKKGPALLFIHGWCCDSRYWRAQIPYFSEKYRVIVMDIAGHGHSGTTRSDYTMKSFGEDAAAVADAAVKEKVILVGHSMGGPVAAEAAVIMKDKALGIIGVDTLENVEYLLTEKEFEHMTAPLKKDFKKGCAGFVRSMIRPESDPETVNWIISDMSSAPADIALSSLESMLAQFKSGDSAKIFHGLKIPVVTVNADLWPVNYKGNRKHMFSYDAVILKNSDHFLMMNKPDEFNRALEKAVNMILGKKED